MKKILYTVALFFVTFSAAHSQNIWSINYDVGFPVGDLSDYVSKPSWRGFGVSGASYITDNINIGGTFVWSGYYDKNDRTTYSEPGTDLTSAVWKYMYVTTLSFDVNYSFMPGGAIQPYAGFGMGPYYVQQETQAGRYLIVDKNWKFALAPQIGVNMPFGASDWGLHVRARYNNVFYNVNDMKNLSNISVSVGFVYIGF